MTEQTGSVLTPSQREYLRGEKDVDPESSHGRMIESRIRDRLQAAISDLDLILSTLGPDDISQALAETENDLEAGSRHPVASSMKVLPALVYLYHREEETAAEDRNDGWMTATEVESGIKTALERMDVAYDDVDVDIHVQRGDPLSKLADEPLASLSRQQLDQLNATGHITDKEYGEALVRKSAADNSAETDE